MEIAEFPVDDKAVSQDLAAENHRPAPYSHAQPVAMGNKLARSPQLTYSCQEMMNANPAAHRTFLAVFVIVFSSISSLGASENECARTAGRNDPSGRLSSSKIVRCIGKGCQMPMTKVQKAVIALVGVTVVLGTSTAASVALTESFDKPVRKTVVNLGRSPYLMPNSPARIQLSCYYYQNFMVKELNNPGLKGVRWVSVTPVINEDAPVCRLAHISKERIMAKEWWSFEGVKGSLLFLEAADGDDNGGIPFRILDLETGKKIFEDSAWWNGHLEFVHTTDESVSLMYLRVVGGDCSIPKDGMSCWSKFRRRYGLLIATVPKCTGYRHEGEKEWVVGDEGVPPEETDTPSTIAYPVVVKLSPRPSIKAVPGPVKCRPVE